MPETSTIVPAGRRVGDRRYRILIVGGGAGGLELAVRLGDDLGKHDRAEVVLVDPHPTHVWKPLLHEVAAGTLPADEGGLDYLQQARRHGFRFHLGAMTGLRRSRKEITLAPLLDEDGREIAPRRTLWFDTLVIAVGSRDNDFGIPGVREHAVPLNGPDDAEYFHRRLLSLIASAELTDRGPARVVIVGGGATGVELAAELADATRELASYGSRLQAHGGGVRLAVIDHATRLLPSLPEEVGQKAAEDLRRLEVDIRLGFKVAEVRPGRVVLSRDHEQTVLESDITVWAAGIRCPEWLAGLDGLETNRLHQLVVTPTLQTTRDPDIFAMGDCASYTPADDKAPVPPKAQAAQQEAFMLARSLKRRLQGKPLLNFVYHDRGFLVSLGRHDVVGNVIEGSRGRSLRVEGQLARFSYWVLHLRHLATLLGLGHTLLAVLGTWLAGRTQPRVKLH